MVRPNVAIYSEISVSRASSCIDVKVMQLTRQFLFSLLVCKILALKRRIVSKRVTQRSASIRLSGKFPSFHVTFFILYYFVDLCTMHFVVTE